jgi:phosphomannomutase
MSREFAEETAAVAAGAGFRVLLFERPVPTPVLAFTVLEHKTAGGVMVTASHNPARDNGYKAYWENGAQIVPPHDAAIASAMQAVKSVIDLPRVSPGERRVRGLQESLGEALEQRYLERVQALTSTGRGPHASELCIAYTALHGVGERFARAALAAAGFTQVHSVAEQSDPDPDFPTVAFPNPEEKGAMDRVLALAERVHADLVIANDPDADRLAVAARAHDGKLRVLTGNQTGVLLAEHLLASDGERGPRMVLSSIVSTPMIAEIARAHGALWEPTLTGFKWVCNRAMQLERERGLRFVFGFEEALGYSIGTLVRDKDGISSAVAVAQLAAQLKAERRSLFVALEALFRRHGVHASGQISIRLEGPDGPTRREAIMADARSKPPKELAGRAVEAAIDLETGTVSGTPRLTLALPTSDVLLWELASGHRVIVRPSGTEPKIKIYLDVREAAAPGEPIEAAQARAQATLDALAGELRQRMGG